MNRKLRNVLTLVAACLVLVWCIPSVGQVLKGSISGTVVDPQGAVISNAQVKSTNLATGASLTTTSDSSGLFRFNLIPVGEYKVEVSAQGFKTAAQSNVAVIAGRDTAVGALKLTVGERSETVEVTAAAPLIETSQAQVTNTFSGTALQTFAGVQENQGLDNLALFVPGVAATRADSNFSNFNGGQGFSVNGLRGRNNDQQIDGQNNNDNSVGGPGLFVSDAEFVQQYVLVTNQFGPEYGRNAGSVVNIITKSGSNTWHGSVFGTENNSVMNSLTNQQKNPVFGNNLTHPPRLNDEFSGFTIGGPWIKNKLFVFGGFDNEINSNSSIYSSNNITPTPAGIAALQGCFPGSASIAALAKFGPYAISGGNPTPLLPAGATTIPTATVAGCPNVELAGVQRLVPTPAHFYNFPVKVDWQRANDTVTARYLYNRSTFFNASDNGAAGYVFNEPALSQAMLVSWTRNLTARMVNEARVSFGRLNVEFGGNSIGAPEPSADQLDQALANISFNTSAQSLGFGPATNLPQQRIVNTWQAQDNWNLVWGKHTFKSGVNWTYQRSPNIFLPQINGAYRFSNWSSFALNQPNRIRIANGPSQLDFREYDTFVYGGDDWKISNNLTLNLGLTWTYYGQPANLFNDITLPRESNPGTAFWASVEPSGTNNLGDTFTNPGASIPLSARTEPKIDAPKNSFGPSFGFAYSPQWGGFLTGNGKTVIRGGYRYLYDPPFYNIYLNVSTSTPEVFLQSFTGSLLAGKTLPAVPNGPNVRASLAPSLQKGVFDPREFAQTNITPNFGPDKVHSWSLGIERELTKNAVVEVRYAGNHAYNLFQTLDGNPKIDDLKRDFPNLVPAGLTPCPASQALFINAGAPFGGADPVGRLNCSAGVVRTRANSGFSNYHALQTEFRANNLFKQLTVRTSYTLAKNLDNVSEIFSTFGGGNTAFFAQNPANQVNGAGEYSFSALDFRNTWSLLVTEQLPFFKEQHGFLGHLMGGWAFSANYLLASGQRYTPIQGGAEAAVSAAGDYYDFGYIASFAGVDVARPFLGSLNAPQTAVGIFCGDAGVCGPGLLPTDLISFTALGQTCFSVNPTLAAGPCNVVPVKKSDVRFILNAATAQSVFGTPFGDTPRNPVTDAISNIGNFSIFKNFKISERTSFEFHATALNVFNHPNFQSVDPFIDDAGQQGFLNGFGDPKLSDTIPGVVNFPVVASRRVLVGGTIRF